MAIEIKDLCHTYSRGSAFAKKALNQVNLTIDSGSFVGLIGHTGSGKSTLVQHLNVLLRPESGQILIDGEDINADKARLKAIRTKVGLVFQYPEHQLFDMTVYKDVSFGPKNAGLEEDEIKERVEAALTLVGIAPELWEKSPFELSGGQKRRVAIAGVLAMRPEILVLDEPAAGLDPRGRNEILDQIKQMHETLKITVILVSHSMEDIARLVERILVISHGEIVLSGAPAEIFAQIEALEALGLSSTQTAYIMRDLQAKGMSLPDNIFTVEDAVAAILRALK
ncbi:MAG: energy-coupling factor transporter ATPase [Clostridiales bacterium]|jgi:energy-coupling factor transport system ATP-binding protein|nr:energy-coupling factor transporter ATPase [Clostridiales bacterium]